MFRGRAPFVFWALAAQAADAGEAEVAEPVAERQDDADDWREHRDGRVRGDGLRKSLELSDLLALDFAGLHAGLRVGETEDAVAFELAKDADAVGAVVEEAGVAEADDVVAAPRGGVAGVGRELLFGDVVAAGPVGAFERLFCGRGGGVDDGSCGQGQDCGEGGDAGRAVLCAHTHLIYVYAARVTAVRKFFGTPKRRRLTGAPWCERLRGRRWRLPVHRGVGAPRRYDVAARADPHDPPGAPLHPSELRQPVDPVVERAQPAQVPGVRLAAVAVFVDVVRLRLRGRRAAVRPAAPGAVGVDHPPVLVVGKPRPVRVERPLHRRDKRDVAVALQLALEQFRAREHGAVGHLDPDVVAVAGEDPDIVGHGEHDVGDGRGFGDGFAAEEPGGGVEKRIALRVGLHRVDDVLELRRGPDEGEPHCAVGVARHAVAVRGRRRGCAFEGSRLTTHLRPVARRRAQRLAELPALRGVGDRARRAGDVRERVQAVAVLQRLVAAAALVGAVGGRAVEGGGDGDKLLGAIRLHAARGELRGGHARDEARERDGAAVQVDERVDVCQGVHADHIMGPSGQVTRVCDSSPILPPRGNRGGLRCV